MKSNGTYHSPFSAREVVEILQKAKELGIQRLRLDGFEADFEPWQVETQSDRGSEPRSDSRPYGLESCNECGHEKIRGPRGNYYCRPCWIKRKRGGR